MMSEQEYAFVIIDSSMTDMLPEKMIAILVPDVKKALLIPHDELENFREDVLSSDLYERECTPDDLELYSDLSNNAYKDERNGVIVFTEEAPLEFKITHAYITKKEICLPKIKPHASKQHFYSNQNFNNKINTKSKAANGKSYRR